MSEKVKITRPNPPVDLLFDDKYLLGGFIPAPEVETFVAETFLDSDSILFNEDHLHLTQANIGYLWTNVLNIKQGRRVAGTAETLMLRGAKWQTERQKFQMREWFGSDNFDFLITLDANYCNEVEAVLFCALLDHELYHCGQAKDAFGMPKFSRDTGKPKFAMRGHDLEEFIGVYRRYGLIDEQSKEIAKIANMQPEIEGLKVAQLCGACA